MSTREKLHLKLAVVAGIPALRRQPNFKVSLGSQNKLDTKK